MKYLLFFACALLSFSTFGQSEYSQEELQDFTDLYLKAKSLDIKADLDVQGLMTAHNITSERYRSILHLSLVDELPELASNELAFIKELKQENAALSQKKELALIEFLKLEDYKFEVYQEIEKKYKTDLKFQRSLKPFFDNSLKIN